MRVRKFIFYCIKLILAFFYLIVVPLSASGSHRGHRERITNSQLENFLTAITDWDAGNVHSHLEGGMQYSHGRLIVPQDGEYYVYAQLYFHSGGRVVIRKNHRELITMLQHPYKVAAGPHYAGGAFYFKANDTIELLTATPVTLFMATAPSYFGAFLIE